MSDQLPFSPLTLEAICEREQRAAFGVADWTDILRSQPRRFDWVDFPDAIAELAEFRAMKAARSARNKL